ncbi:MAG: leucine-rich repeat protein [Acetatifactor sp.]|nr:leucine-rich repeat protein [Acetatifactor sp.]
MRKRRVFALLLALSLVVSGNGMTILAAEQGADVPISVSQEEAGENPSGDNQEKEEAAEGETKKPSADQDTSDVTKDPSAEEEKPSEGENPAEGEKPSEGENSGEEENPSEGENPGEEGKPSEGETPGEEEKPSEGENPGEEENPDEPEDEDGTEKLPDGDEVTPPADGEPVVDGEEPVAEDTEAEKPTETADEPEVLTYKSRMVDFMDDTGMRITYDANAEQQYIYVVDGNGTLTGVNVKGGTEEEPTETPADFSGNVELKQPEEGTKYKSIASGVFGANTKVTYVKLPEGVETIGADAFKGCTALKGVYLPGTVKKIGDSAFEGCTAMSQIAVPKTVTEIGASAFKGDARLHMVFMKDVDYCDLLSIGDHAFEGCSVLSEFCSDTQFLIPTKLQSIGEAAFKGCKAIRGLNFSKTKLNEMGANAFQGCTGLTDLTLGDNLTLIPEHAFDGCSALTAVNFVNGENLTIDRWAFANCYNIKQLTLPQSVVAINDYAFQGCTKLTRVQIGYDKINLTKDAFPVGEAKELVIIANPGSNGYDYARDNGVGPDADKYYKYIIEDVEGAVKADGKFPGGSVWAGLAGQSAFDQNINKANGGKGVKSGTEKYYIYYKANEGYTFDDDALRCNGQPMQKEKGAYYFTMPEGGVVITAGFVADTPDNIKGKTVTVEFSAGTPLQNGLMDEYGYLGVELKIGQSTRMFLLDEDGKTIPASKIVKLTSSNEKVAVVDKNGVITAAGTGSGEKADAKITAVVKGGDGREITINRTISVTTAEAKAITLKASGYPESTSSVEIHGPADGIQTLAITKGYVSREGLSFTLKANVYDGMEGISKKLTWSSSNSKVATVKNASTEGKDSSNVVSVPKGCEGEATITVTANNASGAEKEKVTQKFVVQVYQEGFTLTSSSVTVNPNETSGGTIELISAYNKDLDKVGIKLYEEESQGKAGGISSDFVATYDEESSSANCKRFRIKPVASTIKNGTYKVRVGVNGSVNETSFMPLTITVKRTIPTPTIKFNSKKVKFNLFYKDGRSTEDSEPTVVTTEITKLGSAKIEKVLLEPLSTKADDKLFLENFVIDEEESDLSAGKVIIRRSEGNNGNLKYTSGKKPAVTGYLVIYYKGYENSAAKKMKVTMPTCTTPPSYALRETKATYPANSRIQTEFFELYDKKSKTKEQVVLDGRYTITEEQSDLIQNPGPTIQPDGTIKIGFIPDKGKLKLVLKNQNWDKDKDGKERTLSYTYTVSVSESAPTIKTNPATVTVNQNYPEKAVSFALASNQKGVEIYDSQVFTPVITRSNESEIGKLDVQYKDGQGIVSIKPGQTVKNGTYKFECYPKTGYVGDGTVKKFNLSVKVVNTKPTVKFGKGSLQLNLAVYDNNNSATAKDDELYIETSEIPFTVNTKPEGYTLAKVGGGADETEIKCTTRGKEDVANHLNFVITEGDPEEKTSDMLRVSLKDRNLTKGTYTFSMTQRYMKPGMTTVSTKPVSFKVKVISTNDIGLTVAAKGKINLVNREGEADVKNGIIYTPTLKNIKGEITDVKIYDSGNLEKESQYFDIAMIEEGKDAGKFFVTPKKTVAGAPEVPDQPGTPGTEEKPGTPEEPDDSEKPGGSEGSGEPGNPDDGKEPAQPENPDGNSDGDGGTAGGGSPEGTPDNGGDTTGDSNTSGTPEGGGDNAGTEGGNPSGSGENTDDNTPPATTSGIEGIGTSLLLAKTRAAKALASSGTAEAITVSGAAKTLETAGAASPTPPMSREYDYASLNYNQEYMVYIWVKVKGYAGSPSMNGGILSKAVKIKAAQVLPKVTTDKSTLDVYLSTKDYDATFVVKPKEGSVGTIETVDFLEKDETARDSFRLTQVPQADGSMKVIVHLREAVGFANGSSNNVKMYVKFRGQGVNTPETATSFTMKINVH